MRLSRLDSGHGFLTKAFFALIRAMSRQPTPEVLKLVMYRPAFLGTCLKTLTHEAMRGPSSWSVGDRELMAALVSKTNDCEFCVKTHSTVAARAYRDEARVSAALADPDTTALEEPLGPVLRMLVKQARERVLDVDDMRGVLAAGVSREEIEDALAVSFAFNIMNRLADAFGFAVPDQTVFDAGAKFLLSRGYR